MFAFLTKFKTEVRDFIANAHTRFDELEAKIVVIYNEIVAKAKAEETKIVSAVEAKVDSVKNDAIQAVATKVEASTDTSGSPQAVAAQQAAADTTPKA